MDNTNMLDATAIDKITTLARQNQVGVDFMPVPKEAIPKGLIVDTPHAAIITNGRGEIKIANLSEVTELYRGKPASRTGTAKTTTLDSFCRLTNRHSNTDSVVFVNSNWQKPSMTAVIDYHERANDEEDAEANGHHAIFTPGDDPLARFGRHKIAYEFPLSEEWKAWIENNKQPMKQLDFAIFLEDHIHEISMATKEERELWEKQFKTSFADPITLLDLSRGLEVKVGATIANKTRLQTGEIQMVFETTHQDSQGNELIVPGLFMLSIPVFYRGEAIRIPVRLRYRASGSDLIWFYELFRPDQAIDDHVRLAVTEVEKKTRLPVFDGSPEH